MKYYDYVSQSKVDQLAAQIQGLPLFERLKLGGSACGVSGQTEISFKSQPDAPLLKKLRKVEKALRKKHAIGSINHPAPWFEGEGNALIVKPYENTDAIFYFLRVGQTYLALGGSKGHVFGQEQGRERKFGMSYADHLIDVLLMFDKRPEDYYQSEEQMMKSAEVAVSGDDNWDPIIFSQCHRRHANTFDTPIRFLARRIKARNYMDKRIVLATPLFIERL